MPKMTNRARARCEIEVKMRAVSEPKAVPSSNITLRRVDRSVVLLLRAKLRAHIDDAIRRVIAAKRRQCRAANDEKFFPLALPCVFIAIMQGMMLERLTPTPCPSAESS